MMPGMGLGGRRVDLGPLQLGQVDGQGVAWRIGADGLQGWDSAEVRSSVTQREAAHGAWMGPTYLGERVITLGGTIAAPSPQLLDGAVEQLLAAVPMESGYATLTVYETVPKQAMVRQSGKPVIKYETDTVVTWSLLVTAPDPRRYGTDLRTASTGLPSTTGGLVLPAATPWTLSATTVTGFISATNEGSIASLPALSIAGPVQQPSVSVRYPDGTVTTLAYSQTLGAGDVLVLDCAAHTAVLGGASRRRYLSGPWPSIPASSVQILFSAPVYSSTAQLTATWRAAWK
ncbi:phage tail domain-containing protein [Actinacidiphila sp. ITFR-21]|uniref:phage tail domain-containing protein n=1 Tax=Actinacidiphila sp. ITFR-21 TaxID=3075199 RepID=UPI0028891429|nr:phage tail domain-containing protein [Streptomyces sp. ITFR-21]WNI16904.1 phage tail family protein [Streptomyces sp. ITFR-21]